MATARHQQTDGQSENAIKVLKNALRAFANHHQDDWDKNLWAMEFSHNQLVNTSTGYSPFYLDLGRHPRTPAAITTTSRNPAADSLVDHLKDLLSVAQDRIRQAQDRQAANYNSRRAPAPEYAVNDLVLLRRDGIKLDTEDQRPDALLPRWLGPYKIIGIDQERDNVTLDLPATIRIHPTFHVSLLRPYQDPTKDFPTRPAPPRPPPIDPENQEYEIEEILASRKRHKRQEYLVKWLGYPESENTWEPASNLDCPDLLLAFHGSRQQHQR
jgi:hypothetical protein